MALYEGSSIAAPPWKTLNCSELFKRSCPAIAVQENRYIFVACGHFAHNHDIQLSRSVAMYDLQTNIQQSLPDFPTGIRHCSGAVLNNYFYVITYDEIYRMSLSTRSAWERIHTPEIEDTIYNVFDAISDGNNLLFFQRSDEDFDRIDTFLYDPQKNNCKKLQHLPKSRMGFASAIIGKTVFIIGGYTGCHGAPMCTDRVDVLDIPSQSWSRAPSLPKALFRAAATVIGRWIIVTGGLLNRSDKSSQTYIYDTFFQKWTERKTVITPPRYNHFCATVGSQIVFVGGEYGHHDYCPIQTIHKHYLAPNWEIIKHFILLRALVYKGRAYPVIASKLQKVDKKTNTTKVIQKLITDLNWEIFREILSLLLDYM